MNAVREALLNAATDHTLVGDASSAGASPGSPAGADSATSDDIGLASRVVGAVLPGTGASEHVGILLTLGLLLAAAGVTAMRRSTAGALFTVDHGRQPRARETPPRRLGRYSDPR